MFREIPVQQRELVAATTSDLFLRVMRSLLAASEQPRLDFYNRGTI